MKEQDLAVRERKVEIRTLADDADQSLHFYLLRPHVVVADPHLTTCRAHACGKNADSRRLTCAVWPKQSEDLSAIDVERQSIQGDDLACRLVLVLAAPTKVAKPTTGGKWRRRSVNFAKVCCANAG